MALADLGDHDLIRAHRAGDGRAFDEVLRRYRDRMWATALRTLADPDAAADAVQDACLSAFRGAGEFRSEAAVSTWLHRIVINACLMNVRSRAALRETALLDDDRIEVATDIFADRQLRLDIEQALARLPAHQRVPLVLVELEGLTVDEVAQLLSIQSGTVKSRCARGRQRLAAMLGHLRPRPTTATVPILGTQKEDGPSSETVS